MNYDKFIKMSKFKILYITCKNNKEAKQIAKSLVKKKLIACANMFPNISSIYMWKKEIYSSSETVLVAKTIKSKIKNIIRLVKKNHSYECPCIVFADIKNGNKDFLNWITKSVKS